MDANNNLKETILSVLPLRDNGISIMEMPKADMHTILRKTTGSNIWDMTCRPVKKKSEDEAIRD